MRRRLSRLAPEEIVGAILLGAAVIAVALQPQAVGRIFESPYATPAPESGATTFLRDASDVPAPSADPTERPRTRPAVPVFLEAPQVLEAAGGRTIVYDRSGARLVEIRDPCWDAAIAAVRAGGQPVVCAPLMPVLTAPLPVPSR